MSMFKKVVNSIAGRFGYSIVSSHRPGLDIMNDLCQLFSSESILTILDVGANDGSMALDFSNNFRAATIYAFEPVSSTFDTLAANVKANKRIKPYQRALGVTSGKERINVFGNNSQLSSMRAGFDSTTTEEVHVDTISRFTSIHEINRIDLLKTDTEGMDLDVLRGAEPLLREGRIRAIYKEIGFNVEDCRHSFLPPILDYLHSFNYQIASFVELHQSANGILQYGNALFIYKG